MGACEGAGLLHMIMPRHLGRPYVAFPVVWYKFVNVWPENEPNGESTEAELERV